MTKKILQLEEEDEEFLRKLLEIELIQDFVADTKLECSYNKILRELNNKEREYVTWMLSEEDIQLVAEKSELSLEGRDMDEIARQFQKGISSLLGSGGYDWTDVLEEAIENTPQEFEGTEGQDRESYTDTQDRENYSIEEPEKE